MDGSVQRFDIQKVMSLAEDLVTVFKSSKDHDILMQTCTAAKSFHSLCEEDFHEVHNSLEECKKTILNCKQKVSEVESKMIADQELENLRGELEDVDARERLLCEELRKIKDEINNMDQQRITLEERKAAIKRNDKDLVKSQHVLSMCACVTRILPDLDDPSKISGYIVDKDKKHHESFEFEPTYPLEVCNRLWEKVEQ